MIRLALISLHTPTETNLRGASALPYHLLAFRPRDIEVEVWSFNLNSCSKEQIRRSESELGLKINIIPRPRFMRLLHPAPVRMVLPKPMLAYLTLRDSTIKQIKDYWGDSEGLLWIYGEDIAHLAKDFSGVPTVITTPDCEAMYYHRILEMKGIPLSKKAMARYALMYHRYAKTASEYPTGDNITYHLVGKEDTLFLKRLNPKANAVFINHPHYSLSKFEPAAIKPGEKIKLLIAGAYNFTMAQAADEAFDAMATLPQSVKDRYMITFLGKGWDKSARKLRESGFVVEQKGFVEDYAEEVTSHHIQLTPVCVGTGTKGKVLDAFANGLMVIGTPLALENIAAERGSECIEYTTGEDLKEVLSELWQDQSRTSEIAKAGKEAVLTKHSRQKIADEFFSLFQKYNNATFNRNANV